MFHQNKTVAFRLTVSVESLEQRLRVHFTHNTGKLQQQKRCGQKVQQAYINYSKEAKAVRHA